MPLNSNEVLALAYADLACYGAAMYPGFEMAAHHEIIIDALEEIERGSIRRLMIFEPPRHGKSLICTCLFPAWYLGRHPDRAVITATYGQELSDSFGRRVRGFVTDPRHQAIFPECQLAADSSSVGRFDTKAGGSYYAVGRGGALTGRGGNLVVVDDPLKDREEANSETTRRGLHDWWNSVLYTRLQPGGAIVLVQTRWHEDDLAGRLLREQPGEWTVISLPAIAEVDEGWRKAGEALWEKQYPLTTLEQIRTAIGSSAFVSLYQQRPVPAGGGVFKREWFGTYRETPPSFKKVVQSWDTAFKKGIENDYSGVHDLGRNPKWLLLAARLAGARLVSGTETSSRNSGRPVEAGQDPDRRQSEWSKFDPRATKQHEIPSATH